MKILKNILKIFGIIISGFIIILLCFIGLANFLFSSNETKVDSRQLVESNNFKQLHRSIKSNSEIKNIAVLPEEEYIVINGTIINTSKQTFGLEPDLGFYAAYYEEGNKTPYISIDSLFRTRNIKLDSLQTFAIINKMKSTKISDIIISKEAITYRWKVSAMYGEEGLIYSNKEIDKDSTHFDLLENISDKFYHFAVYE